MHYAEPHLDDDYDTYSVDGKELNQEEFGYAVVGGGGVVPANPDL